MSNIDFFLTLAGTWLLSFSDTAARTTVKSTQGNDWHDSHGRGAIDDWVLVLTDNQGIARTYHMDISGMYRINSVKNKIGGSLLKTEDGHSYFCCTFVHLPLTRRYCSGCENITDLRQVIHI